MVILVHKTSKASWAVFPSKDKITDLIFKRCVTKLGTFFYLMDELSFGYFCTSSFTEFIVYHFKGLFWEASNIRRSCSNCINVYLSFDIQISFQLFVERNVLRVLWLSQREWLYQIWFWDWLGKVTRLSQPILLRSKTQNQSCFARTRFLARRGLMYSSRVLIGFLGCLHQLWFARFISLI